MKTIKQIISDADPRLKGVLVIMIAYVIVMATTITAGATQEIKGYKETIEIQYQDGAQEAKDYLVRQDSVKNVLKELDVTLGNKDTVNKDMSYIVQSKDLLQVNRISEEEVEEVQYVDSQTIETTGLHLFTTEVVQQGQQGQINNKVKVTYENGKIVKKELLSSEVVTEKTDTIIAYGTVQPGAYFTGKLTTYGGDCAGGNGTSSSGISLSPTTGVKGSNSAKLSYNGGSYYCLAADPSIPFGTIIKITNHNLGIESTAYGIVVDRGGAIKKNHIDIFNGTEAGKYFRGGSSSNTQFEIVSVGSGKNFWK
ncbi:3D domain-containing protein [Faecalibacillus faecis]|uniref:3D domain-containing protein n=1 Tax=Faecalibacillus faecis TaxID=1982628 RepID=UPI0022E663D1|nr:G5 domain-containing protein [Faecalibacillus faecis]